LKITFRAERQGTLRAESGDPARAEKPPQEARTATSHPLSPVEPATESAIFALLTLKVN
jgi:hypothetical protein